jgi:hypothetical protein
MSSSIPAIKTRYMKERLGRIAAALAEMRELDIW